MSKNNSSNNSERKNHRQPNFIPLVVNSDDETGRKKRGEAGDSPEEPAEKVVGKAKVEKPSPKRKVSKQKRKSRKRTHIVHPRSKNKNILKESETHLFGKKFRSHMIEIEKSRKKTLEAFKDICDKKSLFRKGPSHSQNKPHGGGDYYHAGKPGNRDQHKHGKFQNPFQHNS